MKAKCKECSAPFVVTEGEKDFYKAKGFPVPKRCRDCRQKNRERKNENRPFDGKLDDFNSNGNE